MMGQVGGDSAGHCQDPKSITGLSWYGLDCRDEALLAPILNKQGQSEAVAGGGRSLLSMYPCVPPTWH